MSHRRQVTDPIHLVGMALLIAVYSAPFGICAEARSPAEIVALIESAATFPAQSPTRQKLFDKANDALMASRADSSVRADVSKLCEATIAKMIKDRGPYWSDVVRLCQWLSSDMVASAIRDTATSIASDDASHVAEVLKACATTGTVRRLLEYSANRTNPPWCAQVSQTVLVSMLLRQDGAPDSQALSGAASGVYSEYVQHCLRDLAIVANALQEARKRCDDMSFDARASAAKVLATFGIPVDSRRRLSEVPHDWSRVVSQMENVLLKQMQECMKERPTMPSSVPLTRGTPPAGHFICMELVQSCAPAVSSMRPERRMGHCRDATRAPSQGLNRRPPRRPHNAVAPVLPACGWPQSE